MGNEVLIGRSIYIEAPKIETIEAKNMVTENPCKVRAMRGKGKQPVATLNEVYTKKEKILTSFDTVGKIVNNLKKFFDTDFVPLTESLAYIKGQKLFGECELVRAEKKVIVYSRSSRDRGQHLTIKGKPAACYPDPTVQYIGGRHWIKID